MASSDDSDQPPHRYDATLANQIELAWQARWEAEGTFKVPNRAGSLAAGFEEAAGRPKAYILDFFPYPSGTGLGLARHLGGAVIARLVVVPGRIVNVVTQVIR